MKQTCAFTILELLLVVAIVGIIAGITVVSGRQILQGQEEQAVIHSFRQGVLQSATAASARGEKVRLVKQGNELQLKDESNTVFQRFDLAASVTTNLDDGLILAFHPSGKATNWSYNRLTRPLRFETEKTTYLISVSLIGETKVVIQ